MSTNNIKRTMTVTGVGRVAAPPDLLLLNLAVETQAVTTSEALVEANKHLSGLLSALKEHGVQDRDVQTTQLSIDPVTARQDQNDTGLPKIVAYRVRNGLNAKLRDIQRAGAVIDAAVEAGGDATRIEGISFSYANPSSLLIEARKRAIDDAKDRAQQLVGGLGVGLGNVISISESDLSGGPPTVRQFAFAASTPISSGESVMAHQVTIGYEISSK